MLIAFNIFDLTRCQRDGALDQRRGSAFFKAARAVVAFGLLTLAAGCARMEPPENLEARLYDPEKTEANVYQAAIGNEELSYHKMQCPPPGTPDFIMPAARRKPANLQDRLTMRFSPGDRFNLLVPGSPEFSGDYAVNADGRIILPFSGMVSAVGLTHEELGKRIQAEFVRSGLFKDEFFRVSIRPVQYAPINISVSGAVFYPGRHGINSIKDSDKLASVLAKFGDSPVERFIPAALQSAGGVRPDADLARIRLKRNGQTYVLDWRGALTGESVDDVALIEGDQIHVEETSCFQSLLVRPSQITPPGIRIFQSNLTQPSTSNASSAIGKDTLGIPYGTRFLQGLVNTNCVGGSLASNARRYGVLISRNPKTLKTEVIQRSVEELVRSPDRDAVNPYLMPDDAIACYDSAVTDAREIATTVQTMVNPVQTIHSFHKWGSSIATSGR
jgi:polysaccharide biosynthesis/export protein